LVKKVLKTQVGIIGAGPAGLTLSRMLSLIGIDSIIIENQSREYIEKRIRAGVLEAGTFELLNEIGMGERMMREGMMHHAVELRFDRTRHMVDLSGLTGKDIMVYGQAEIVKDLIAQHIEIDNRPLLFGVSDVRLVEIMSDNPQIEFSHEGQKLGIECKIIAGCDGFHGVSRPSIPADTLKNYEHKFPFAWLGILAQAVPSTENVIYANHEKGFALHSMRSPKIVRNYIQCNVDDDVENWSDDRIWSELQQRMELDEGFSLNEGKILEKGITPMRGFIADPMQYGNLFLAGDAAHIVPPTGAKGLNLALRDVKFLCRGIEQKIINGNGQYLVSYTRDCLPHVWHAQYFSWWMTRMLHKFQENDPYQTQLQLAQLRHVASSQSASRTLAENYVGLF